MPLGAEARACFWGWARAFRSASWRAKSACIEPLPSWRLCCGQCPWCSCWCWSTAYGVMGMLECLRAPRTALGVPAAGDVAGSPSCRGVSLSRSRRNCWLFIVVRTAGLGGLGGARVEKFRRAEGLLDSRAACSIAGTHPRHHHVPSPQSPIPTPHKRATSPQEPRTPVQSCICQYRRLTVLRMFWPCS